MFAVYVILRSRSIQLSSFSVFLCSGGVWGGLAGGDGGGGGSASGADADGRYAMEKFQETQPSNQSSR